MHPRPEEDNKPDKAEARYLGMDRQPDNIQTYYDIDFSDREDCNDRKTMEDLYLEIWCLAILPL